MIARPRRHAMLAAATLLGVAVYFVLVELHRSDVVGANDIYAYFMPNILYAVQSVADGGKGLLWNPLQGCGEPFFANTVNGLLYPPHLLFLILDPNTALHVVLIVNMALGAIGALLMARELGLSWLAAVGGALAFQLGDPMAQLTSWSPMHNGPWVWLPWALLLCERLLRAPTRRDVVGLTLALALELLPGFVLITAFTYQLIAFRVAWELCTRRSELPWRSAVSIAAAMALAPLLLAVQLMPAAEYAARSFRVVTSGSNSSALPTWVLLPFISLPSAFSRLARRELPVPFSIALAVLAGVAVLSSRTRRLAVFYLCIGTFYAVLALGDATPLYHTFVKLPPGAATLRVPYRFFWVTGFSLTMLTALALQNLALPATRSRPRWTPFVIATLVTTILYVVIPGGLRWAELLAATVILASILTATISPGLSRPAAWLVVVAIGFNLASAPLRWPGRLLASADVLFTHADSFASLRSLMTAQDRVFLVPDLQAAIGFTLMQKTASVLRVPGFHDYEALLGHRFSQYFTATFRLLLPQKKTRADQVQVTPQHRLLDIASVRYLVAPTADDPLLRVPDLKRSPVLSWTLDFFENDAALPRARYVPRIEIVADADALLQRLAQGTDDLREVALVEAAMPSGFVGTSGKHRAGDVRFVTNDAEHLTLDVAAPERGFVVLADTYYPGWRASVNGVAAPIVQANYMFRLVEVPAGTSRVELYYRPSSVALGAAISLLTFALLIVVWRTGGRKGGGNQSASA